MPVYETSEPITVTLELSVGNVRIAASDRTDTVVEVRPSDETDESDVRAAAQVRVDCTGGVLRVTGPRRLFDFSRRTRSVDVSIELPSGSRVGADLQMGDVAGTGRLGECRIRTSAGDVRLERTGPARLSTSIGHVTADAVAGNAEVFTGSGRIQLGEVGGTAALRNANGDSTIGAVSGDLRVRASNGDIRVERAGAGVDAKTSNGSVRLGEVTHGPVVLGTAMGDLDIGIAGGTATLLEVKTGFGRLRNLLEPVPAGTARPVEVRGHTSCGDITVHPS